MDVSGEAFDSSSQAHQISRTAVMCPFRIFPAYFFSAKMHLAKERASKLAFLEYERVIGMETRKGFAGKKCANEEFIPGKSAISELEFLHN